MQPRLTFLHLFLILFRWARWLGRLCWLDWLGRLCWLDWLGRLCWLDWFRRQHWNHWLFNLCWFHRLESIFCDYLDGLDFALPEVSQAGS